MVSTRSDLSFATNLLSPFVNKNNKQDWEYLKGVLRYTKGASDSKLVWRKNMSRNFEIFTDYVDSDWAGDEITKISTTGFSFKLFVECTICENTKKQRSVAGLFIATEYMALYEAEKEAL